ncbi:MAG: hypothetical protein GEV03_09825 [Streptosporangiales bacterium]|nr:hypothetical protein [Streptosporangiales bacterium]
MYVVRLPNGDLRVPQSALSADGRVLGDAYVEIGPDDPEYERLLPQSITEDELAERQRRWQEDDQALREQFLAWKAEQEEARPDG